MALLDIVTFEGVAMESLFERGDLGVLVDVQGGQQNEFTLPSTGGTCNYPIENDVRGGVGYGAGGTEFTGNVVLPAESEVETGVMYGANGTEFEGTFAGGGGGSSEHSLTFVT